VYVLQVLFDDDYTLDNLSRKCIRTASEHRELYPKDLSHRLEGERGAEPAMLEFEDAESSLQTLTTMSPREMYARRCDECELCQMPDCGACLSCRRNKRAAPNHEHEVCLRKVRDGGVAVEILSSCVDRTS